MFNSNLTKIHHSTLTVWLQTSPKLHHWLPISLITRKSDFKSHQNYITFSSPSDVLWNPQEDQVGSGFPLGLPENCLFFMKGDIQSYFPPGLFEFFYCLLSFMKDENKSHFSPGIPEYIEATYHILSREIITSITFFHLAFDKCSFNICIFVTNILFRTSD